MIITYHNVEVKRCLAHFDTIARPENNAKNSAPQHCLFCIIFGSCYRLLRALHSRNRRKQYAQRKGEKGKT